MEFEIVLTDVNDDLCEAWRQVFRHPNVTVEPGSMFEVAADAYVSPANSHGIMDGGLDRLLRNRFPGVDARVQAAIDEIGGMLPVGQALVVETDDPDIPYMVSAPTMVYPANISGTRNVYAAMLAILRVVAHYNSANDNAIRSIAIPGLGTGVGRMSPEGTAAQMRDAFDDFLP
jgi:O-acetyl-ADP-ribose deacetylase (regulator of RNase III)